MTDAPPPLLFAAATSTDRRQLAQWKRAGRIRQVAPRLYVSVPEAETGKTIRNAWPTIVARLFPDAVITHRTALEFIPTPAGEIFLTAPTKRKVIYPGLVLRFVPGPGPLVDDPKFMSVRCASLPRALLENLATRGLASARLPVDKIEERLADVLDHGGEAELNRLRDRAREIANELGWPKQLARLEQLIGTLLGTRTGTLASPAVRARVGGEPFEPACLRRLQILFGALRTPITGEHESFTAPDHAKNKAFFDAYFSNYIEGTTFEIEEAEAIVFDRHIPAQRPKDAHDILGTFAIVSNPAEMRRTPRDLDALIALLTTRHQTMMARRPEVAPGEFKTVANRAGDSHFVRPADVIGTLRKGMELYQDVAPGLARAIFMMFLVAEVHPFLDGNGRTARIMMNAELTAAGQATIIIPTVFRDDYLQGLRALTRRDRPELLVKLLIKAQRFSHLKFSPYPRILEKLTRRNWFREPDDARIDDG